MVASLAFMHGRRVWLNIVAGGFTNDLTALGDETPHDERHEQATEYARVMHGLLAGEVTTVAGNYYWVRNLHTMSPQVPDDLRPGVLMSGSSPAGLAAAHAIGAVRVKYPKPPGEEEGAGTRWDSECDSGSSPAKPKRRHGRSHTRAFRNNREGKIGKRNPYWLVPFQNYKTFLPVPRRRI